MLRCFIFCTGWLAVFALAAMGTAATIDKTNNAGNLNLGSSWVGGTVPSSGDVARWSSTVTGLNTVSLGADTNWLGIKVTNPGGAVTVNSGNTLALGGSGIDLSAATTNLTLNCALTLLADQSWDFSSISALTLGGAVGGGPVTLTKTGGGTVNLNALNALSGSVAVNAGRLVLNNQCALGFAAATVASGAQLYIGSATTYTNALTLTGNGTDNQGAVRFNGGTAGWSGPITLAGGARIGGYAASGSYTFSGGIGGTGDLRIWAGGASSTHIHTFTISAPCSYTGNTLLDTYAACPVVVLSGGANSLPTNSVLTMLAGVWNGQVLTATLKLNGNSHAFAGLMSGSGVFGAGGANRVVNGGATAATLTINNASDMFFDGSLGGPGANENNFGLTKSGAGKLSVKDPCTHTGATAVNGGILNLLGPFNGGAVTVADGASLLLGNGTSTMTSLTLSANAALGVNVGAPTNLNNTAIQVNGNLVLGGTIIVQDLGDAAVSNVVTVINYTGTLSNLGLTTDARSQWSVQVDTSTSGKVKLILQSKLAMLAFTTANTTVSNSLQFDMQGVLHGFPLTPVWYEVRTPDGQLWDFGAMPPTPAWTIRLRHLRLGTNNVRAFTLGAGNALQQDTRQVVLQSGTNPPVRPRPYPAEIWWGGVATGLAPDYGFSQLVDSTRPWPFVQQYQDGIFLHGILPTTGTLAKLAAAVAPYLGRFAREDGYYTQADPNFGFSNAGGYNSDLQSLAGAGVHISFHSMDYNPGMKVWAGVIDPGWCGKWPNWTHTQLMNSNMQCWADFTSSVHSNWPGLKLGMTWSPVWFNWGGHPALVPSGDNLTLHPVTDTAGNAITNQYGTNAWFDFDMQEFFDKVSATAQAGDGYYGFASDCPWEYFATWSNYTDRTNNQAKILGYEAWQRTNGYFPTTICNYGSASSSDTNAWDASWTQSSFAYISTKQQLGGRTRRYLFESWYSGPYTWAPDSNTNSFSGMVGQAIKYLKGIADTNGTLEPLNLTVAGGRGAFKQIQLQNNGDIRCLPALVALPGAAPGVTTRFFTTNGSELTASLQTAEGLCFTNLLQPGAATNLVAITTATGLAAATNESASLEAYWNPQDPLGIVRDRVWLAPTLDPLGDWQSQDIGSGRLPGGVGLSSNVFSVIGSGADIWGTADAFRFVYLPVTGDAIITARVSAQLNSDPWAKAGLMARESLAVGARNALMALTPGNGMTFQYRGTTNGSSAYSSQAGTVAPYWVRLVRAGTNLTGYYSSNGTNWSQLSSTVVTNLAANIYFGLAVCSHSTSLASVATLDSVAVTGSNTNHAPVFIAIPNRTIVAGYTLQVPVASYVTDTDSPPQVLTYSLVAAPTNATVDSATGLFAWRPLLSQAPLVTSVRLAAADNGSPSLSATQSFWVTVNPPSQPRFATPAWSNGLFTFMVDGDAGPDYSFLGSTNLIDWWPIWTNYSAMAPFEFTDPAATNFSRRFYRVRLGP
jgi:autotransporter-associated beta strand protein